MVLLYFSVTIVIVSRLVYRKGIDLLAQVMADICVKYCKVRILYISNQVLSWTGVYLSLAFAYLIIYTSYFGNRNNMLDSNILTVKSNYIKLWCTILGSTWIDSSLITKSMNVLPSLCLSQGELFCLKLYFNVILLSLVFHSLKTVKRYYCIFFYTFVYVILKMPI